MILEISRTLLQLLPRVMFSPDTALIFWLVIGLVAMQYHRMARSAAGLHRRWPPMTLQLTVSAVGLGLLGGIAGSYIMVLTGISLGPGDVLYLWPVALVLMLFHPRFICFSYAGGIVSLSHLVFGWPDVNVTGIIGLVAVLHIVEGALAYVSGHHGAVPMYLRHESGRVVGGYTIQRFWPVPIVILLMMALPPEARGGAIAMPDWWPLIGPSIPVDPAAVSLVMFPVAAALGYGDMAVTASPKDKSRGVAKLLVAYSITLLALTWWGYRWPPALWLAAAASPVLHEVMIQMSVRRELTGEPVFVSPERGVLVMEVLPGGWGASLNLGHGDVLLNINGRPVDSAGDVGEALRDASFFLEVEGTRGGGDFTVSTNRFRLTADGLGVILAPDAHMRPQVEIQRSGFLGRLLARARSRFG